MAVALVPCTPRHIPTYILYEKYCIKTISNNGKRTRYFFFHRHDAPRMIGDVHILSTIHLAKTFRMLGRKSWT